MIPVCNLSPFLAVGVVPMDITNKCVLLNFRSLNNRLPEFHKLLSDNLSMLFITESWLNESITNSMLDCSHCYTIYRKDRPHQQHGGRVILAWCHKAFDQILYHCSLIFIQLGLLIVV